MLSHTTKHLLPLTSHILRQNGYNLPFFADEPVVACFLMAAYRYYGLKDIRYQSRRYPPRESVASWRVEEGRKQYVEVKRGARKMSGSLPFVFRRLGWGRAPMLMWEGGRWVCIFLTGTRKLGVYHLNKELWLSCYPIPNVHHVRHPRPTDFVLWLEWHKALKFYSKIHTHWTQQCQLFQKHYLVPVE